MSDLGEMSSAFLDMLHLHWYAAVICSQVFRLGYIAS